MEAERTRTRELALEVADEAGRARALRVLIDGAPTSTGTCLVLWHGAGSDADEPALAGLAARLARAGHAVARPRFPFRQRARDTGSRRPPERLAHLVAQARATWWALSVHDTLFQGAPTRWILGGRSLGARVACHVAAEPDTSDPPLAGVLALAYPLAPPRAKRPRATPFEQLARPLLVVQGGRDPFGDAAALARATDASRTSIVELRHADHGLVEPARGRAPEVILDEVAARAVAWIAEL